MTKINLNNLTTEQRNQDTFGLDSMSVKEALVLMNKEDERGAEAGRKELDSIDSIM